MNNFIQVSREIVQGKLLSLEDKLVRTALWQVYVAIWFKKLNGLMAKQFEG